MSLRLRDLELGQILRVRKYVAFNDNEMLLKDSLVVVVSKEESDVHGLVTYSRPGSYGRYQIGVEGRIFRLVTQNRGKDDNLASLYEEFNP